jgi:hypothetical protein
MKNLKDFKSYNESILTASAAVGATIFAIKKISDYIYDWKNNKEYYDKFGKFVTGEKKTVKGYEFKEIKNNDGYWYSINLDNKIYVLNQNDMIEFENAPNIETLKKHTSFANPNMYGRKNRDAPSF